MTTHLDGRFQLETGDLLDLIESLGIHIVSQTAQHYLCLCPFHDNTGSPAFEIDKESGLWLCFNQACGERGNLKSLIAKLNPEAVSSNLTRMVDQIHQDKYHKIDVVREMQEIFGENKEAEIDWSDIVESLSVNYDDEKEVNEKLSYMVERGFSRHTLRHFEVGWSAKKGRIVIPVRNENFKLVGIIGRAVDPERKPKYLYSDGLPKKGILFNLPYAKTYKSVIVCEGSLDCMNIYQAGFPNVVAALGAHMTETQGDLINRYFLDVIIFPDNDAAGKALGESIAHHCSSRNIYYAQYPEGIKDPGEMTSEQIKLAIENKRSQLDMIFGTMFGD